MNPYPSAPPPSSGVVIQSPLSFVGSYRRLHKMTRKLPALTWPLFVLTLMLVWSFVLCWTLMFGLLLVPWRLLRRGARKRKLEARRHDEMIAAAMSRPVPAQPYVIPERDLFTPRDNPPGFPLPRASSDIGREDWP